MDKEQEALTHNGDQSRLQMKAISLFLTVWMDSENIRQLKQACVSHLYVEAKQVEFFRNREKYDG